MNNICDECGENFIVDLKRNYCRECYNMILLSNVLRASRFEDATLKKKELKSYVNDRYQKK